MVFKLKCLILLSLIVAVLSSCSKIDETFTQFEVEYTSMITVDNSMIINLPIDLLTPEIETNSETEFAVNITRKDLIEEILLREINLNVIRPEDQRLDFLNEIRVFINADGLSELEIAFKDPVPNDVGDTLTLDVNENNLREYIIKDNFSLRINVISDQITNEDVDIEVYSKFFVDAKLIDL